MSGTTYRFSAALSAALLVLSILAVPAGATHIAGLPDDPLDCVADPLACLTDPLEDPLGGGLPGVGSGPGLGGVLPPGQGGTPPGLGGGLPPGLGGTPPGLGGGLPGGIAPPTPPSAPTGSAPPVAPPPIEEAPASKPNESKPAESKPDSSPKTTSGPAAERVFVEPAGGHTTSTGPQTNGSLSSSKKADSRGARARGPLSAAINGSGPEPPAAAAAAASATTSLRQPEKGGVKAFAGQLIHQIPEQYRWPVFLLACMATFFALNTLRERFRTMRAENRALTDSLTNLPNRRAFERVLAREYRRADRYDRPLSMLLLDLDGFKEINDTQGHAAGDEILRNAAVAISSRVRPDDLAARLGGDEFVVICPETSAASAQELARSLEETLAEASIKSSIGVAEREAEDDGLPEYLVARADAAMYRRKQRSGEGRERRSHAAAPRTVAGLAAA